MPTSVIQVVRLGKRAYIDELNYLFHTTRFVEVLGNLIHALQAERGGSSIFLSSQGSLFADTRVAHLVESERAEKEFQDILQTHLERPPFSRIKYFHYMSWVLIGLGELPAIRGRIEKQELSAEDCMVIFGRLIASLISVIFEVVDSSVDPRISAPLVALFNLIQGKEFAGQERALGGLFLASEGRVDTHAAKLNYLIDAQQRHFQIFEEFAGNEIAGMWHKVIETKNTKQLVSMRGMFASSERMIERNLSEKWFEICSERLYEIWTLQCRLTLHIKKLCNELIRQSQNDLQNSEVLLSMLNTIPSSRMELAEGFFDPSIPLEHILQFNFLAGQKVSENASMQEAFSAQALRLNRLEQELTAAKRTLEERKSIERAKGILMARFKLSEEESYKRMRSSAMEQNKRMVEVAEQVLSLNTTA